jgi:hypothetical protein
MDLKGWKLLPEDRVFTKERYSACPSIRHLDGWFFYEGPLPVKTEIGFRPESTCGPFFYPSAERSPVPKWVASEAVTAAPSTGEQ